MSAEGLYVELVYFKTNGTFYSTGSYTTHMKFMWEITGEVRAMLNKRELPGLISGHDNKIVLVDVPGHQHNCPTLVMEDLDDLTS
jgi:hypothetical protein